MDKYLNDVMAQAADELARLQTVNAALVDRLEKSAHWMDFVAEKLGNANELDRNIRKYGARAWVKQFGEGAAHRANEVRAALKSAKAP